MNGRRLLPLLFRIDYARPIAPAGNSGSLATTTLPGRRVGTMQLIWAGRIATSPM